MNSVSWSKCAN